MQRRNFVTVRWERLVPKTTTTPGYLRKDKKTAENMCEAVVWAQALKTTYGAALRFVSVETRIV